MVKDRMLNERFMQKFFLLFYIGILMLLAICWPDDTPITSGIMNIIRSPDVLMNDYVATGGVRACLINAALVGLAGYGLLLITRTPISGPTIAAVWMTTGYAMFGKNIFNIGPIILGVYLYSLVRKEPFRQHVIVALFGTSLAPVVSQLTFTYGQGVIAGIMVGTVIGFFLPAMVKHLVHNHQGYLLYNVGFAAGFVGTLFAAQAKAFGLATDLQSVWSTEHSLPLTVIFAIYFASFVLLGLLLDPGCWRKMGRLMRYPGTLVTDFVSLLGMPVTLVNMGLVGLIGLTYVVLVGGDVNGPTLAALFSMLGFAAFGKHPRNIVPLMLGVYGGTLLNVYNAAAPGPLLAALFVTGLAPISGSFGPLVGILAGYLHLGLVTHVGWLHGGVNLYNNGFAGGLVALVIVAIARAFRNTDN